MNIKYEWREESVVFMYTVSGFAEMAGPIPDASLPHYIKKMHGLRSKIPSKNLVRQRCAEGFNSGVKGLMV
jgi:hypothetical protein